MKQAIKTTPIFLRIPDKLLFELDVIMEMDENYNRSFFIRAAIKEYIKRRLLDKNEKEGDRNK